MMNATIRISSTDIHVSRGNVRTSSILFSVGPTDPFYRYTAVAASLPRVGPPTPFYLASLFGVGPTTSNTQYSIDNIRHDAHFTDIVDSNNVCASDYGRSNRCRSPH